MPTSAKVLSAERRVGSHNHALNRGCGGSCPDLLAAGAPPSPSPIPGPAQSDPELLDPPPPPCVLMLPGSRRVLADVRSEVHMALVKKDDQLISRLRKAWEQWAVAAWSICRRAGAAATTRRPGAAAW